MVRICRKVDGRAVSRRAGRVFVVARIPSDDEGARGASEAGTGHVSPRVAAIFVLVTAGAAVLGAAGGAAVRRLPVNDALDSHERYRGEEVGRVSALARGGSLREVISSVSNRTEWDIKDVHMGNKMAGLS